ncbi:MAG: hypothetical protein JSS40_02660 [Proteobacteria bacterium]|nr:hypothetical protein [Pseudomonadota bacterium]
MFLGVTEVGWGLLAVFYLPLAILVLVRVNRALTLPLQWKVPSLAIAAGILFVLPVADAAWSSWRMHRLCPEAGLKVLQRVVVDGYFDEELTWMAYPDSTQSKAKYAEALRAKGYRFWEYYNPLKKQYIRIDRTPDGSVIQRFFDRPTARYHYKKWMFTNLGMGVKRSERHILDSVTREDIASEISISRYPGFVDRLWLGWFGPLQGLETCFQKGQGQLDVEAKNILIPVDKN